MNLSLRSGYVIAPAVLAAPLLATHTAVNFCAPTPLQKASAAAFERAEKEGYFHWMAGMMQELSREDVPLCSVSWVFICSMPCFSSLSLLSFLFGGDNVTVTIFDVLVCFFDKSSTHLSLLQLP